MFILLLTERTRKTKHFVLLMLTLCVYSLPCACVYDCVLGALRYNVTDVVVKSRLNVMQGRLQSLELGVKFG